MRWLFFAALLFWSNIAHATIAVRTQGTNIGNATTSCSVTGGTVAAGDDLLIVAGADNLNATGSAPVISSYSNTGAATLTWTAIGPLAGVNVHFTNLGTAYATLGMARAHATTSGTYTITVHFSGTIDNCGAIQLAIESQNSSTPIDTNAGVPYNNGGVSASGAPSIANVSTSCASDLIIEVAGWWGTGGNPPSQTTGTGFTTVNTFNVDNGANFGMMAYQYGVFASTQSSATLSFGTSWNANLSMLVAYQDAAATCSGGAKPLPAGSLMLLGVGE